MNSIKDLKASISNLTVLRDHSYSKYNFYRKKLKEAEEELSKLICEDKLKELTPKSVMEIDSKHLTYPHPYREVEEWIHSHKGLYTCPYIRKLKDGRHQIGLSVKFDQNLPFEDQLSILDFIPYIEESYDDDYNENNLNEYKTFSVFEFSLSADGIYYVRFKEEKAYLCVIRFHTFSILKSGTMMDVLEYIYNNHPYEKKI